MQSGASTGSLRGMAAEALPLKGRRVLLTRARTQCAALAEAVRRLGGVPVVAPCIAIETNPKAVAEAMAEIAPGDDLLLTSANAVRALIESGVGLPSSVRTIAVGAQTAKALAKAGISVDIVPEKQHQEGIWQALNAQGLAKRVFFLRAKEGRDWIVERLQQKGVQVRLIPAYCVRCAVEERARVQSTLQQGVDAALFGSRKTAECFLQLAGEALAKKALSRAVVVAISDRAASPLRALGLRVELAQTSASFEAMLATLKRCFSEETK